MASFSSVTVPSVAQSSVLSYWAPDASSSALEVSVVNANPTATTLAWDCEKYDPLFGFCVAMPTQVITVAPTLFVQTITMPDYEVYTKTGADIPLLTATISCNVKGTEQASCAYTATYSNKSIETSTLTMTGTDMAYQLFTATAGVQKLTAASTATTTSTSARGTSNPANPTGNSTNPQTGAPSQSGGPGGNGAGFIKPLGTLFAPLLLGALYMALH